MKKLLCIMMALALMLPSFLTLPAAAAEEDWTNQEQLIALAKKTFPEYSDKLEAKGAPYSGNTATRAAENIQVAVKETRPVDKNTIMTYTEYTSGLVSLAAARFSCDANLDINHTEDHNIFRTYTATIVGTVVEGPTFTARNVQYSIYPSDYDRILSAGSYSTNDPVSSTVDCVLNRFETASKCAAAYYTFPAYVGGVYYTGRVSFEISRNQTYLDCQVF